MAFTAPTIVANGTTPLGAAVRLAMSKIDEQKARYKANGIPYNRPWVFAITDGNPNDADWELAAAACKAAEANNQLTFSASAPAKPTWSRWPCSRPAPRSSCRA